MASDYVRVPGMRSKADFLECMRVADQQRAARHKALELNEISEELPNDAADRDQATLLEIGRSLRNTRIARRMKLKDVAERVGCSVSMLSKIECGKAAPSLRILHRIGAALETSIAALFSAAPERDVVIYRKGERPVVNVDPTGRNAGVSLERLVPFSPQRVLEGNIHHVWPGGDNGGPISHFGEEVGYVIEGRLEFTAGNETFTLGPGDSFFLKSEVLHSYRNVGDCPARILWINTPPTF